MCVYVVDVCAPDTCVCMCLMVHLVHVCLCAVCMCNIYPIFGGVYDWWCMLCMCGTCACILYIHVYMMHNFTYIFGGAFDV